MNPPGVGVFIKRPGRGEPVALADILNLFGRELEDIASRLDDVATLTP